MCSSDLQQVSAYGEYKNIEDRQYMFRDAIVSSHAWSDATTNRANSSTYVVYPRFYVGDATGNNVDYGPTAFENGAYSLRWGNAATQQFVNEQVRVGTAIASDGSATGGIKNSRTILKSEGAVLQSFLLRDRLITTFGLRRDRSYSRLGGTPTYLDPVMIDEASFNSWAGEIGRAHV